MGQTNILRQKDVGYLSKVTHTAFDTGHLTICKNGPKLEG